MKRVYELADQILIRKSWWRYSLIQLALFPYRVFRFLQVGGILLILFPCSGHANQSDTNSGQIRSKGQISILATGDITVGSGLTPVLRRHGLDVLFRQISVEIQNADIAIATLNTSISDQGEPQYAAETSNQRLAQSFRAIPDLAVSIAQAGWDVISLTTPHLLDFGPLAAEDTIRHLNRNGIKTIGAGLSTHSANDPAWVRPRVTADIVDPADDRSSGLVSARRGAQVAFVTYYHAGAFNVDGQIKLARALYSEMTNQTRDLATKSDLLVVMMHWGKAVQTEAVSNRQQFFAQALIEAGADLVLSQRLHTLQGIQIFKGKPIIYSLADLIYENFDKRHAQIVIPKVIFHNRQLQHIELIPVWVGNPKAKYQPQILSGEQAKTTLTKYQQLCQSLNTTVSVEIDRGWIRP